jgi:hypothetical protein
MSKNIKIVHLLMAPFDEAFHQKQQKSINCFSKLVEYVKAYTQQISFPNKTELPVDTCADPFYIREAPAEDGVWLSYGHYGAYSAHRRAVLEEFSEDVDALVIVEGDVVFDILPVDMAQKFHLACEFAEKNDASFVTFAHVGFGVGSDASKMDTSIPMGDYTKIDHFICAHCYMITRKERENIQQKLKDTKWHAWDTWLYWNYDKKVPIFRTKEPLVYEPEGYSMIDLKQKEINFKI